MARFLRTDTNSSGGHSRLRGPVPPIVTPAFVASPVAVHLAYSKRGKPLSGLGDPVVIGAGIAFHGPGVRLTDPFSPNRLNRRKASYGLKPPTVVTPAPVFTASPVEVKLASSTRLSRGTHSRLPQVVYAAMVYAPISGVLTPPRDRNPLTHSRLAPPTVVTPVSTGVAPPTHVTLARIRPFPTDGSVFKPAVIAQAQGTQGGIGIQLAPSFRGKPKSFLRAPIVVTAVATEVFFGPKVDLAKTKPVRTISRLAPPVVVAPVLARPTVTHLSYSVRGKPKARLAPPTVVAPVLAPPVHVTLARIKPAPIHSVLRRPTDLVDQQDLGFVRVRLAYSLRGKAKPRLIPPTVIAPVLAAPIVVSLSYSTRGTPKSRLFAPAVVAAFVETLARPLDVTLARILPVRTNPVLRRPVDLVDSADLGFVRVRLAYSLRGRPKSILRPPTVVAPVLASPISTTLVRIRPVATRWLLRKPVDLVDRDDLGTVRVHLAYGLRGKAKSRLSAPTVIAPVLARPIDVTLVRIRPVRTTAILRKPVDLVDQQDVGSLRTHLAYSLRGKPKSRLLPPTVVAPVLARPIDTTLTRIRPVPTRYILRRPVDLVDRDDLGAVKTHLAYSLRGKPKPRLAPPAVVAPVLARAIDVTLVRIRPVRTQAILGKPADLVDAADLGFVRVHLAYQSKGKPKSRLTAPAVVGPVLARKILVTLAPQKRGAPKSILRPPTVVTPRVEDAVADITLVRILPVATHSVLRLPAVVGPGIYYRGILVQLAPSFRGTPKSVLNPPPKTTPQPAPIYPLFVTLAPPSRGRAKPFLRQTIYGAKLYAPISVTLVPSRFPIPKSVLRKPVVVQTFRVPVIATTLVRITPPPVHSALRKPTDLVDAQDLGFVRVHLVPSRFPIPQSRLFPPTAVDTFTVPVVSVTLAPQARRKTVSRLLPPAVVTQQFASREIQVSFVRIRPRRTTWLLRKPVVVGARLDVYFGPTVKLALSRRGKPFSFLGGIVYKTCYGTVVGIDTAATVCGDTFAATVTGSESAATVSGTTSAATVEGTTSSRGTVTGGDTQREGC